MAQIMANPTEELAQYASMAQGQAVTVEDLRQNRDGVAEMLAVRNFTAELMTESNTEKRVNMIREKVASERYGNLRESASFADEVGTDGAAVYRMDDGRYVIVTADGAEGNEGKYRVGFSETADFDEDHVMMHDGLEGETVTKTLAGLADGSLTYNNDSQRVEPAQTVKNAPASGESVVGGQVSAEGANVAKRAENAGETRRAIDVDRKAVLEIRENAELAERIAASQESKYDTIRKYLIEKLGGHTFTMSDGRRAVMDKSDAKELSHNASEARTVQLGNLRDIVEKAVYDNSEYNVKHNKFSAFHYYTVSVKYGNKVFDLWINVGVAKNDGANHIYALTNKKEEAPTHYGVSRPVGNAIQNASSNTSIPQNSEKSTLSDKKVSAEENGSKRSAVPKTREAKKRKLKRAQEHQKQQKAKKKAERLAEAMRSEKMGERRENGTAGTSISTEAISPSGRGYSDTEANEARKLVKNFDLLQPAARRAIIELYRSGKASGASQTFMRHAANLIAYWRTGLWIIADDKIRDDGFFYVFDDGTRLITVKPAAEGRSITEAFMHELGHDVWERADKETRHELYGMAVSGVDKTKLREIRKRYQAELSERGETVTNELLYEEIFANLLGEYIGTEDFLSRFGGGDVSALTRIKKTLSVMKKRFTGKDKYLYRKADDLFKAFTKVMAGQKSMGGATESKSVKRSALAHDKDGNRYWYIETEKDIFKDIKSKKEIRKAAYDLLLSNRDRNVILEDIDGKKIEFIRISAEEFTNSEESKALAQNDFSTFKQKMRLAPSLQELITYSSVNWDSPDLKNHKLFKEKGFRNYRGKVRIDNVIFNYIVRVGKTKTKDVFYDINIEVARYLPHAKGTSDIKSATSNDDTLPASKVTAIISSRQIAGTKDVAGSQPLRSASTGNSIAQNSEKSTSSEKKVSENNGSKRSALPKTVKADAVKLANMAIERWLKLQEYIPEDEVRQTLKICNRQYIQYSKLKTMLKNNLIALLDQTFPDVNKLFTSQPRKSDGHEKWVDFALKFWHCECVCGISEKQFKDKYERWCKRNGYHYSNYKAEDIYIEACGNVGLLPKCESTKVLITQAIIQLQAIEETLSTLKNEMQKLSSSLPEYDTVMSLYGVGEVLGPQLIAEIGDVTRFKSKKSLVAFAGIDSPPDQSGQVDKRSKAITKRGSASLRKILFQIMTVIIQNCPKNEPVYTYLDKKRSEGKPYKIYMIAAANKFLRIYYAKVKECLVNT